MYCSNCGKEVDVNAFVCTNCGVQTQTGNKLANIDNPNDKGGFWWGVLGFFVPLAGFILFLVWRDEKPKTSKATGIGALASIISQIVFVVLIYIFLILFAISINAHAL